MALNLPTIRGNHERQVLTQIDRPTSGIDLHTAELLNQKQRDWLNNLPVTLRLNEDILMVHGAVESDVDYFIQSISNAELRVATHDEAKSRAKDSDAKVILCGHTHTPGHIELDDGRLIVNPGSVGLQACRTNDPVPHKVQTLSPHARYAILSKGPKGWSAEHISVAYDWENAAERASSNGHEDWANWLRTGVA